MEDLIEDVHKCIVKYNLRTGSRRRRIVNRRMFFFNLLSEHNISKTHIARYFGLHHATVLHGLKQYQNLKKDKIYLEDTAIIRRYFDIKKKYYNIDYSQSKYILNDYDLFSIMIEVRKNIADIERRLSLIRKTLKDL